MELIVLGLVASIGFAGYAWWSKARAAELTTPPELEAPERTVGTLQVGDIVQHLGTDWLVEGVLTLSDDGRGTRLYRLADGALERFLFAGHAEPEAALLAAAPGVQVEGAPERVEHDGQSYQLKTRESAAVLREGTVGERRALNAGSRVGVAAYTAGALRLVVLSWADQCDAFVGERVPTHLLEFLPGK